MQAEIIDHLRFTVISPAMIKRMSVAKLIVPDTYNEDGYPIDGGLVDQRLGVIDPGLRCKTCGGKIRSCSGHFGHIELVRPVIHPEFAKVIFILLKATCQSCHRVLVSKKQIDDFRIALKEEEIAEQMLASIKKLSKCPYCGAKQQDVKLE